MTTTDDIFSIIAQSTARADAATKGPWTACEPGDYADYDGNCVMLLGDDLRIAVTLGAHPKSVANASLIAHARTDLPARDAALKVAVEALDFYADMMGSVPANEALQNILSILKGGQA